MKSFIREIASESSKVAVSHASATDGIRQAQPRVHQQITSFVSMRRTSRPVQFFRLMRMGLHIAQGLLTAAVAFPWMTYEAREQMKQRWSQKLLRLLNMEVRVQGVPPVGQAGGNMFVANHVSWTDIFALNSVKPVCFIAKTEVRAWPLVGWLAEKTGTIFIERSRRQDTGRIAAIATAALRAGRCLCFFPEGTTTDGTTLLPFKASLLQPAIEAGAQVWPLAIRYPLADGSINTAIAYWGDVTMLQSLAEVLKQHHMVIELHFFGTIPAAGKERRALAQEARQVIAASLNLPQHVAPEIPAGLPAATQ